MKKQVLFIMVISAVLGYVFLKPDDDPREIEAVFNKAIEAGKKKDLEGVTEHFSINYRDEYGATYPAVKNLVQAFFDNYDGFDAEYFGLSVSINETEEGDKQAVANVEVYVSGFKSGVPSPILGSEESPENLTVTLSKSKVGGWKIIKVEGLEEAEGEL